MVKIIGAGLAGSEAAWQLVTRGVAVELIEMRPVVMTKAHKTDRCAELVCSNSFRGADLSNAVGLLKAELREMGSLIMEAALAAQVPAGGALAVDRVAFSNFIHDRITTHPLISFKRDQILDVPESTAKHPVIIATGPLTSKSLADAIVKLTGRESLAFFDAISPIILGSSIDESKMFRQSRYDKGGGDDYLNIPLLEAEYNAFVDAVAAGEKAGAHEDVESDKVDNLRPFEGCMPIEEMIARGRETLLFGPMKPVGLTDPSSGKRPHAVIQLRQDDQAGALWSMVGFQTKLKYGEQQRIFRSLPGLSEAEFVRLGSVHRNTFIDSPKCLNPSLEFRTRDGLFFAGQITGVEGYVESTAGGLVAGINAWKKLNGEEPVVFPSNTAIGALLHYISDPARENFQPMNISFGLFPGYGELARRDERGRKISKTDRRYAMAEEALGTVRRLRAEIGGFASTHTAGLKSSSPW